MLCEENSDAKISCMEGKRASLQGNFMTGKQWSDEMGKVVYSTEPEEKGGPKILLQSDSTDKNWMMCHDPCIQFPEGKL